MGNPGVLGALPSLRTLDDSGPQDTSWAPPAHPDPAWTYMRLALDWGPLDESPWALLPHNVPGAPLYGYSHPLLLGFSPVGFGSFSELSGC